MAKVGRPKIQINWEEFDKLCGLHATQVEIASWFGCSVDTIDRAVKAEKQMHFAEYYAQKASTGKISLRRQQWQLAMKGDKTMLIWLGKQYLGQSEKVEQNNKNTHIVEEAQRLANLSEAELVAIIKKELKG